MDEMTLCDKKSMKKTGINPSLLKNSIKETTTTFSRSEGAYTETVIPIPADTTRKTSSKGIPDSTDTLHNI